MSQTCAQCNAPLPLGPSGTIAKCAYCGTETRIAGEGSPGVIVITDPVRRAEILKRIQDDNDRVSAAVAKREALDRLAGRGLIIFTVVICGFCAIAYWRGWILSWRP